MHLRKHIIWVGWNNQCVRIDKWNGFQPFDKLENRKSIFKKSKNSLYLGNQTFRKVYVVGRIMSPGIVAKKMMYMMTKLFGVGGIVVVHGGLCLLVFG